MSLIYSPAISPPLLKRGDQVGIISTARKVSLADMEKCVSVLNSWGLNACFSKHLFKENHQYCGSDEDRRDALQDFMDDTSIAAILCARGGYGTLRMIDKISFDAFSKRPKWIIGFSDVTPLLHACRKAGFQSIHGPMAISFLGKTGDETSLNWLRKILMDGGEIQYEYAPNRQDLIRPGIAEGPLSGGNLSLLSHMIGTPSDFETEGDLLFIEDIDEYLYNIDRLTLHLKRAGKFEKLAGLIAGGMTDMKDNDTPFGKNPDEIVAEHIAPFSYPFAQNFPVGHWPSNYPLVIGRRAQLKVSHVKVELIQAPE